MATFCMQSQTHVLFDWDDAHNAYFCSWKDIFYGNVSLLIVSLNLSNLNLGREISLATGNLRNLQSIFIQGLKGWNYLVMEIDAANP